MKHFDGCPALHFTGRCNCGAELNDPEAWGRRRPWWKYVLMVLCPPYGIYVAVKGGRADGRFFR